MAQNSQMESGSYVRALHAVKDAPAVDVYVDGMIAVRNFEFAYFTNYILLPVGTHTIDVYEAGTEDSPLLAGEIEVPAEQYITVIVYGDLEELKMGYVVDFNGKIGEEEARVRFVHVFPDGPDVTIQADKKVIIQNLQYEYESKYVRVFPGRYEMMIQNANDGSPVISFPLNVEGGYALSVYITGDKPPTGVLPLVDGRKANDFYDFEK